MFSISLWRMAGPGGFGTTPGKRSRSIFGGCPPLSDPSIEVVGRVGDLMLSTPLPLGSTRAASDDAMHSVYSILVGSWLVGARVGLKFE